MASNLNDVQNPSIADDQPWHCDLVINVSNLDAGQETTRPMQNIPGPYLVNLSRYFIDGKEFEFPPYFTGLKFESILITSLKMASAKAGFVLVKKNSKSKTLMAKTGTFQFYTTLCCQQHRLYEKSKNNKGERKRTTSRPTSSENCCNYVFHLRMNAMDSQFNPGRWTISPSRGNVGTHNGHRRMKPEERQDLISGIRAAANDAVAQCNQLSFIDPIAETDEMYQQRIISMTHEGLHLVENDNDLRKHYEDKLQELMNNLQQMASDKQKDQRDNDCRMQPVVGTGVSKQRGKRKRIDI